MKVRMICGDCGSEDIEPQPQYEYGWDTYYPDDSGYAEDYETSEFIGYNYKCKNCGAIDTTTN